jgi:hypothetical protein
MIPKVDATVFSSLHELAHQRLAADAVCLLKSLLLVKKSDSASIQIVVGANYANVAGIDF